MSLWRQLAHGVRALMFSSAADRDADEELRNYLEHAEAERITQGVSPAEARRALRLEYGSPLAMREEVRAGGWEHALETVFADVRYALRGLRRSAAFTVVVVATLALGIGATTAIFSAVKPVLFEPLPYPAADRLAAIWDRRPDGAAAEITFGTYRELIDRSRAFDAIAAIKPWPATLTGDADPERLDGQRVSAPYFRALGVRPSLGRDFAADDDRPNAPNVVIISDGLWRRRFGADPSIVNRTIVVNDTPFTVVGVMPPSFENVVFDTAQVWAPLQYDPALPQNGREWGHHLRAVARLRPDVPFAAAAAELSDIAQHPIVEHPRVPWAALGQGLTIRLLQEDVTSAVRPALVAVLSAVVLVLAIACVNVTNLLLARGAQRRGEMAMRAALGASRGRLVTQSLTESIVLALIGGAIGVGVAHAAVGALVALSPLRLPRLEAVRVDGVVLLFVLAITTVIGIAIGVIPALHASRAQPDTFLRTTRTVAGGHRGTRALLVIVEVALAIVLLVCAGLLVRSLQRVFNVDTGFTPAGLLTMQVPITGRQFDQRAALDGFFDRALEAVQHVPGVTAAAFTSQLPLSGEFEKYGTQFESSPTEGLQDDHSALRYAVSPSYFQTMQIPLRRGRVFTDRDAAGPPVALLNESFAKRRFPGMDPIGQRLHLGRTDQPWMTIVGVVGEVTQTSLALVKSDGVYFEKICRTMSGTEMFWKMRQSA